jgi:predicted phosphodiesterase
MNDEEKGSDQYEQLVLEGLERSYKLAKNQGNKLSCDRQGARIIIFSDHHRGVRDGADDFMGCEKAYNAALGYYLELGYILIILGDAEELWECRPGPVIKAYQGSLLLEAEFHRNNRYYRISGNHDDYWEDPSSVKKLLEPVFGLPLTVKENLRLLFDEGQNNPREIFLVHGHQGDFMSDQSRKISKFFVRYFWRPFQRLTKIKLTTPSKDYKLSDKDSIAMYHWAEKKGGLALIAGHTHLPVFESRDHIGDIETQLARAQAEGNLQQVAELRAKIELAKVNKQGSYSFSMSKPSYFNSGCCSFSDGDITGIEISNGEIKLVRWPDDSGKPAPKTLASNSLENIFAALK